MTGFIFGGDTQITPEQMQARRKIVAQLMRQQGRPRYAAEGAMQGIQSVAAALFNRHLDDKESKAREMGIPGFRRGTNFAPGGLALVGEDGPEFVDLPRGSRVFPNPMTPTYDEDNGPAARRAPYINKPQDYGRRDGFMQPPEPSEYLRDELGDDLFRQYEQMTPQQRMDFINDPANGFVPPAPSDGREGMQFDAQLKPESRFDDARAYQTADLDAFKMMQLEPEYGDIVAHDANSTEARRLQLLRRAMFADAALEDPRLAKAMTRMDNNIAGRLGAVGRMYTNDDYELGRLMAEQFSSAVLRGDSGAQTPEPEVQRYIKQYFPLTGETDEQIQAKRAMRREEIRAMIQSLPEDARPAAAQIQAEIDELKRLADVPDGSLTGEADISDEDREFLKSLGLE